MGKLRSNFMGTEFYLYDSGSNPKETTMGMSASARVEHVRQELGLVQYASNVLGARGPRRMSVWIPRVDRSGEVAEFRPMRKDEGMAERVKADDTSQVRRVRAAPRASFADRCSRTPLISMSFSSVSSRYTTPPFSSQMIELMNKPPRWNEHVSAYVLNFQGRVTMASVKNFQLIERDDEVSGVDTPFMLQFGRVAQETFNMDFCYPLSPLQAFALCLSSFDYKLACE